MRALAFLKMVQVGENRGQPNVANAENISFVHIGSGPFPGGWRPYIVTGTGAQLAALAADINFLVGQEIRYVTDAVINEQLAEEFTLNQLNGWLTNRGYEAVTADNPIGEIRTQNPAIISEMNEWLEAHGYDVLPDVGDGDVQNWRDARHKAIAPGALTKINNWLTNNGYDAMDSSNSVLDLVRVFVPGYSLGADNVHDQFA